MSDLLTPLNAYRPDEMKILRQERYAPPPEKVSEEDWFTTLAASESSIAATMGDGQMPEATDDEIRARAIGAWNVYDYMKQTENRFLDAPSLAHNFAELESPAQVEYMTKLLDREEYVTRLGQQLPYYKSIPAYMAGGLASWSTPADILLGYGLAAKGVQLTKGLLRSGGAAATLTSMDEFILHQDQKTRTMAESGMAAGMGFGVGGVVGYAVGRSAKNLEKQVDDVLYNGEQSVPVSQSSTGTDGGAAATLDGISAADKKAIMNDKTLSPAEKEVAIAQKKGENHEIALAKANPLRLVIKTFGKFLPDTRMLDSSFGTVKRFADNVFNHNLITRGNEAGIANRKLDRARDQAARKTQGILQSALRDEYVKYAKSTDVPSNGKVSYDEFQKDVQIAIASGRNANSPQATAAARRIHSELLEPLGKRLVKAKLLDGDDAGNPLPPMGDKHWFPRSYSRDAALRLSASQYADAWETPHMNALRSNMEAEEVKLSKVRVELNKEMNALKRKHKNEMAKLKARKTEKKDPTKESHKGTGERPAPLTVRELGKKHTLERNAMKKAHAKKLEAPEKKLYDKSQTEAGRLEIRAKYEGMHSRLRTSPDGLIEESGIPMVHFDGESFDVTKGRTIPVPTEHIPREFLGDNQGMMLEAMVNRQEALLTVFEDSRFGQVDFRNVFDDLDKEYGAMLDVANQKGASDRTIGRIRKRYEKAQKDIRTTIKEFYNIREPIEHQAMRDAGTAIKAVISMQKLGSVMLSTTPEIAAGLSQVGIQGMVGHYLSHAFSPRAMSKLSKAQKSDWYIANTIDMAHRHAEHGQYDFGTARWAKNVNKTADFAIDKLFGLGYWTRGMTRQTAIMIQSRLGRLAYKGWDNLADARKTELTRMGFTEGQFRMISKEVQKHGQKVGVGSVDLQINKWDNQDIALAAKEIISGEVHNTLIKPGIGSTPFIGRTMAGSMFLQFRQFILATTSKYFIADMQRLFKGDLKAAQKQIAMLLLGMGQWELRRHMYGIQDEDETLVQKTLAGYSYGGGSGILMDVGNAVDQVIGSGSNARYRGSRGTMGVLGPTPQTFVDSVTAASGLSNMIINGELSNEQIRAMRNTIPGNNYLPIRYGANQIEENVKNYYGN